MNDCRRYCPGHGGYFFGHYTYFDDAWLGQYYYRDAYAAAYQPEIAPDSYYEQLGQQWGADVKNGSVPKERLIALTEVQMLNLPQHSLTAFRRGFLAGYGTGGETVLAQIIKQAQENNAREPMKNPPAEGRKSGAAN